METQILRIGAIEGNATPAVIDACEKLRDGKPCSIVFEKGTYHFGKEGSHMREMHVTNIIPGVKNFIFDLCGVSDLVIDGNGSDFIFDDIVFQFSLLNCRNVTLKNFNIDFSFTRYCQGTVVQSDDKGFELEIDFRHFRVEVDERGHVIFHSVDLSVSTEQRPILMGNVVFGKPPWDYVFAGDSSHTREKLPTRFVETDASRTERGIRFTYRDASSRLVFPLGDQLIFCYEPRCNVNIFALLCENIHIENVSMFRGGGMGIFAMRTRDFFFPLSS